MKESRKFQSVDLKFSRFFHFSQGKFALYQKIEKKSFCWKSLENHLKMIFKQKKNFFCGWDFFFLTWDFLDFLADFYDFWPILTDFCRFHWSGTSKTPPKFQMSGQFWQICRWLKNHISRSFVDPIDTPTPHSPRDWLL